MKLNLKTFIKTNIFYFIILVIVVFALYGKSINYDFVSLDEDTLIVSKIDYLSSLKNIPSFFLTSCYFNNTSFYYRPILTITFSLEASLFGLNTKVYHFTNIILFILAIYLMYVFLIKLKLNKIITKCICLLMTVHPIFVSTVVWVPSRNDTLLAIFIFLSFIFFTKYLENKKIENLLLFYLFFSISLFTKETAILFIVMYSMYIYFFNFNLKIKEIIKIGIIPITLILCVYFYLRSISVASLNISVYFENINKYFINFICGMSIYLRDFFIPLNIPICLHNLHILITEIVLDVIAFIIVLFIGLKNIVNRKIIIFSLCWLGLSIITTFLLQDYVLFYHRLFLPIFGVLIILVLLIDVLIKKYSFLKKIFIYVFVIIFVIFFMKSFIDQNNYKNKELYWSKIYYDAPTWHVSSYGLARLYLSKGNYDKYKELIFQAYNLSTGDTHIFNIANILLDEGKIDEVKQICFNILNDKDVKKFLIKGANKTLGNIYYKENNLQEAYNYLKVAYDLNRFDLETKNKLIEIENKINRK